jgi:hypothetical protein
MYEQLKRGFKIQSVQLLSSNNNWNFLDGSRHNYVMGSIEMNLVSHVQLSDERVSSRDIALDRT